MKKLLSSLSRDRVQKVLFVGVLVMVFGVFFVSLYLSSGNENKPVDPNPQTPVDPSKPNEPEKPDTPDPEKLKLPCQTECVVVRKFYSIDDDVADQELAVIQFGSKYFLSKGLSISSQSGENFDVVVSLSGTVKEVNDSSVYGKTVAIDHGNGIITEYVSLSEVNVEVGDVLTQGDKIGVSGTNEYDVAANNHVHFKVSKDGKYLDPELLIDKEIID